MRPASVLLAFLLLPKVGAVQEPTYNVFAAASLRETVVSVAKEFEARHPGAKVVLNFGGSQQLAAQIRQGADADAFLSAGDLPLKGLLTGNKSPRLFANNSLVVVVPRSDAAFHSLRDLSRFTRLVVADRAVPVGMYTQKMLNNAERAYGRRWRSQVERCIVSREQDVRAVLTKVEIGEAEAGVVYATDAIQASNRVLGIPIPKALNVIADYPAIGFNAKGKSFVTFLLEDVSQGIFRVHGFLSPLVPRGPVYWSDKGQIHKLDSSAIRQYPKRAFKASEDGRMRSFLGFDMRSLLGKSDLRSIEVVGADRYRVVVWARDAAKWGFYLVEDKGGNFKAVFPNQDSSKWVKWVRRIEIR